MASEHLNCQTCGACCVSTWDSPTYVNLTEGDLSELEANMSPRRLARYVGYEDDHRQQYPSLTTKENKQGHVVCTALRGSVGGRCSCSIYEIRPSACMAFARGSLGCKGARQEAGLPT